MMAIETNSSTSVKPCGRRRRVVYGVLLAAVIGHVIFGLPAIGEPNKCSLCYECLKCSNGYGERQGYNGGDFH